MKFQKILFVGILIELSLVPLLDAKRSFGITRSRNKNKGPSVRRNQHGQYDETVPAAHPKPATPELRKPVGYNHNPALGQPAYPVGPNFSPGYSGLGHNSGAHYGAPPAYSPSYASPPGYSNMGFNNQQRFGQGPGAYNSYSSGGMPMGGMGGMQMGGMSAMPMGTSPMGYGGRSSGFGSGIMTNLFAGLAGYQLAKAFSHGGHSRDREIIVINNGQPVNSNAEQATNNEQVASPINSPEYQSNINVSTEIPQAPVTHVGPANNEYNFYGIPQYGIPLYGYSLPSQITDYYQSAIIALPQDIPQPSFEQTDQPISEK